jgi:nitrite reductase (cytochrome c-552)
VLKAQHPDYELFQLGIHSQWRWDFVAASHGGSFHAPLECARILGTAIQKADESRLLLAELLLKLNVKLPVQIPDISSKEKAQKIIGLEMDKLITSKMEFIKAILPQWDSIALKRQGFLYDYK